jgi:hypothetical protein
MFGAGDHVVVAFDFVGPAALVGVVAWVSNVRELLGEGAAKLVAG